MKEKPWSGRFSFDTDAMAETFSASIAFDKRLYRCDIDGSIAYAKALTEAGILTPVEEGHILNGLEEIRREIEDGTFTWSTQFEDIHMHIEQRLRDKIGDVAGKIHTGRSRNDQIALDMRLYLRGAILAMVEGVKTLQRTVVKQAEIHLGVIMPGYTHLRKAQPVLFSHHLMAYHEMFARDHGRLMDALARVNVLPLGSGALAGSPYPIDRAYLARLLGFPAVSRNSIDAVSDRDFAVETLSACALIMLHLSRLCEELIIWSSPEFGFVSLPQTFCTGSSIMPQKENPDILELTRAKTGRVYGSLVSLLTTLKALPLAYNRDLQEDKEPVFDALDTVGACLTIMATLLSAIEVHATRMREAAAQGYTNATDLADYLVKKGVPFRSAHHIVGTIVKHAEERYATLDDIPLKELQSFHPAFDDDVADYVRIESSVDHRTVEGGTATTQVSAQIQRAKEELA